MRVKFGYFDGAQLSGFQQKYKSFNPKFINCLGVIPAQTWKYFFASRESFKFSYVQVLSTSQIETPSNFNY